MPFQSVNSTVATPALGGGRLGLNNYDSPSPVVESNAKIPWLGSPEVTWLYYECTIGVMLDSGMVVHHRLPQVDRTPDSLASINLDDASLANTAGRGVSLQCNDQYTDIVQRMGHARYWFRLWGQALRVGYKIPIPGIKSIGGRTVIPYDKNPQWAYNDIVPGGNYNGAALYRAQWSLWYTILEAPASDIADNLITNPSGHISAVVPPPVDIQVPYSAPDDNATSRTGGRIPI